MLDNELIRLTSTTLTKSIEESDRLTDNLRLIKDALPKELLVKLYNLINQTTIDLWTKVDGQKNPARTALRWRSDSVLEELYQVGDQLTPIVSNLFKSSDQTFQGLQIWRDCEGYSIEPHVDNPIIDISLQIYLFGCSEEYGTSFIVGGKTVAIPFVENSGYLTHKKKLNDRLYHWTSKTLDAGLTRYSLYLTWSQLGQQ